MRERLHLETPHHLQEEAEAAAAAQQSAGLFAGGSEWSPELVRNPFYGATPAEAPASRSMEREQRALQSQLLELDFEWHGANRRVSELESLGRQELSKGGGREASYACGIASEHGKGPEWGPEQVHSTWL